MSEDFVIICKGSLKNRQISCLVKHSASIPIVPVSYSRVSNNGFSEILCNEFQFQGEEYEKNNCYDVFFFSCSI